MELEPMRSYWMSLTVLAIFLAAYTALVLNNHPSTKSAASETQPREPAAQAATQDEAASNVN